MYSYDGKHFSKQNFFNNKSIKLFSIVLLQTMWRGVKKN